jgi:hypothetical protein
VDEIYTGNRTLYLTAKDAQKHLPVIETRLDADDGLPEDFIRDIQGRATQGLARDKLKWLMFCSRTAIEWRINPDTMFGSISNRTELFCLSGVLLPGPLGSVRQLPTDHFPLINQTEIYPRTRAVTMKHQNVWYFGCKNSTGNLLRFARGHQPLQA